MAGSSSLIAGKGGSKTLQYRRDTETIGMASTFTFGDFYFFCLKVQVNYFTANSRFSRGGIIQLQSSKLNVENSYFFNSLVSLTLPAGSADQSLALRDDPRLGKFFKCYFQLSPTLLKLPESIESTLARGVIFYTLINALYHSLAFTSISNFQDATGLILAGKTEII